MSNEPKGTDKLQSEIAKEFRNMNSKPGLEIGLRPELGTFELCEKHYDASRTESEEHCAVCQLEAENATLREAAREFLNKEVGGAVEAYAAKERLRRLV